MAYPKIPIHIKLSNKNDVPIQARCTAMKPDENDWKNALRLLPMVI